MAKTCNGSWVKFPRLERTFMARAPTMAATMTQTNIPVTHWLGYRRFRSRRSV